MSCTTRRARSRSWNLADERAVRHALRPILSGTRHDATLFDRAFSDFMFPGPAGVRQDEMPSTRREPGSDADGRDARVERERRARPSDAAADAADVAPDAGDSPIAPLETADNDAKRRRVSGDRATARSRSRARMRPTWCEPRARGAMPRDRSCGACTWDSRVAGGRRAAVGASTFDARCG